MTNQPKVGDFDDPTNAGITIIVFLCLFILFNKILKLNLGSTTALVLFGGFLLYLRNKNATVSSDLNHQILEAFIALDSPFGLHLDPNLILLFHKLHSIVSSGDSQVNSTAKNANATHAAFSAAQVLLIHNHISTVDGVSDGAIQFQNALDHAKESINSIHSCVYSSDHPIETEIILKVLNSIRSILDDYLQQINNHVNSNFAENPETEENVYAQFIQPSTTKPLDPSKSTTFDFFQ